MRVAVDGFPVSGQRTGVGRYVGDLLRHAALGHPQIDFDVVLSRRHPWGPADVRDLASAGLTPRFPPRLRAKAFWGGRKLGVPVPYEVLSGRADVAFYTSFAWWETRRMPTLSMVYDLSYIFTPDCVEGPNLAALRDNVPWLVSHSELVGTISRSVAAEIEEVFPEAAGRVVVMRPGVAPQLAVPREPQRFLSALGLRPGYVLHVGTIEPRKNLARLIEAAAQLPEPEGGDPRLVLVGRDGWNNAAIRAAIAGAGKQVRYFDFVDDEQLSALYGGAAVLAFPSRYEGFGLPVVEAMALGVPVACSDIPVLREVGGDAVEYFDHEDPSAIANALQAVMSDPDRAERMRADGKIRAGNFQWSEAADAFVSALEGLADW